MASVPLVAIIGRPNTGKSTLFNRMIRKRKAIVSEIPGTTRDQVAETIRTDDVDFLFLDTAGISHVSKDEDFEDDIKKQTEIALSVADVILLTVNSREELTAADFEAASLLRKKRRLHVPVLLVVTKCDNPESIEESLPPFYALGITDEVYAVSSLHRIGTDELLQSIISHLLKLNFSKQTERKEGDAPRVAIVGKPNVGKSSLLNALMSDPQRAKAARLISDTPGTTRDTADIVIRHNSKEYAFIDTAGLKRRTHLVEPLETFAHIRSIQALQECDTAILIIDATLGVSRQGKRIASLAIKEGKGLIVAVNKIDLLQGEKRKSAIESIKVDLQFCQFAPFIALSTNTKEGIAEIFPLIEKIHHNRVQRISTKKLTQWFLDVVKSKSMGTLSKSKLITQIDSIPPTFVLFVKDPKNVGRTSLKYLENRLRKSFSLEGTPIRWLTKVS